MGSIITNGSYESNDKFGEEEACSFAMAITSGSVFPMVLTTAIELNIFEIIKQAGPNAWVSSAQIAAQLPTKNPDAASMLDRMLRLLTSYSVLCCSVRTLFESDGLVESFYGLNPVNCQFLIKNEDGVTLGALANVIQSKIIMESWYHLKDAVINGTSAFKEAHGMSAFECFEKDAEFNTTFNNGMANHSTIVMKKILENYKGFGEVSTLVDVGGGNGATLNIIISKYPSIRGINFDLPHVISNAQTYNGVEHVAGDMFVNVPQADAIFLKWICHDWSDELCTKLLKNCYAALPNGGKLIICEYAIPVMPDTSNATKAVYQHDILMLAVSIGGKERSEQEFEILAKAAGFHGFRVACSAHHTKLMEFFKLN